MAGLSNGWLHPEDSSEERLADQILLDVESGDAGDEASHGGGDAQSEADSERESLIGILEEDPQPLDAVPSASVAPEMPIDAMTGTVPVTSAAPTSEAGPSRTRVRIRRTARKSVPYHHRAAPQAPEADPHHQDIEERLRRQIDEYEMDLRERELMAFHHGREATQYRRRLRYWEYAARRIAANYRMAYHRMSERLSTLRASPHPTAAQVAAFADLTEQAFADARGFETYATSWARNAQND